MHSLPFLPKNFDCVYAANILEHSVAPLIALQEWRRVLTSKGWLIVVMPSQEWLGEYYHFSVLTHSQIKDLLAKAGFKLLAGPQMKPLIDLGKGDIFYDLGRGWGHYDGYVAQRADLPRGRFMLGSRPLAALPSTGPLRLIKQLLKYPYNLVRVWRARHHHE
jgi:SAM-dependent methyltransferase